MRHLDLVVATDSAPVHLAGALGVPVWVLLSASFDWRWGMEEERTPLYPSVRLIRDGARGDWTAAVDRVARDLNARRWGAG
jgi:ADP-heptose:LPS heptosyltransferase